MGKEKKCTLYKKYTSYNGYKIGGLYLNIITMPNDKIPSGYSKVSFKYENNKLDGYQLIDKRGTYAADESVKGSDFTYYMLLMKLLEKLVLMFMIN